MSGFLGEFLTTVGVEYESSALMQESIRNIIMNLLPKKIGKLASYVNITRDASTEFVAKRIPVSSSSILLVSSHTKPAQEFLNGEIDRKTMGYELFTSPLEIPVFESLIYPLIFELQAAGDFTSHRAAIHFHYGFVNNIRYLKNILRISLNLEPVLYRLGGMGGTFRGSCNACAYARPLMNSAAVQVVEKNDGNLQPEQLLELFKKKKAEFVQIINPLAALDATSLKEFWASFGIDYPGGGTGKYHPSRYSGTNFYAIPSHGTIEFRHFNQSHNVPLISALAKFLRAVVELSVTIDKNEIQQFHPINSNEEVSVEVADELINRLNHLFVEKEIENIPSTSEITLLLETLENSHFTAIPEIPVRTHSESSLISAEIANLGKLIKVKEVTDPQHTDIHNISGKTISIFD